MIQKISGRGWAIKKKRMSSLDYVGVEVSALLMSMLHRPYYYVLC